MKQKDILETKNGLSKNMLDDFKQRRPFVTLKWIIKYDDRFDMDNKDIFNIFEGI